MSQELVRITVDDQTVEVPKGMLLVEAAKAANVNIPVFCHHSKLEPAGVCRMCLVEVEGQRKPVTACTLPVTDGMVVRTQTETVTELRKGVLELLLLNHPLDCPVCDKGGECPLQDQTYTYGPVVSRSCDPKVRKLKSAELGNFIVFDRERCILCRRCTRFDTEITLENNLVVGERADGAIITTATGERYDSYFSGNTIEMCPVGALTSEVYRFKARPWDLAKVPSVCTGCSVGCNIRLDYRFGELVRVVSRENPAIDDGWLCDRGRFNYRYVQAENRLQTPMLRTNGKFAPVTWSRALSTLTERLQAVRKEYGGEAIGVIGGGRLTNEEAYLLQKLARIGLGTPHIDFRVGRQILASHGAYPARISDIDNADVILVVDTLLAERAPVLDLRVRKRARKGGRVISVGSVHGAYGVPVTRVDALPDAVAAALDGVKSELQGAERVIAIWGGHDGAIGQALNRLLAALSASGASVGLLIPSEQANMRGAEWNGVHPDLLPGGRAVTDSDARREVEEAWGASLPTGAGMSTEQMLKAASAGGLQALVLFGANLKQTFPDTQLVDAALAKVPFLVVIDLFATDTAEYADLVLPAASFPSKAGAYTALDGSIQPVEPANEPEFETWTDAQIMSGLADMLQVQLFATDQGLQEEMESLGCPTVAGVVPGLSASTVEAIIGAAQQATVQTGAGLVLVPVERLFAGGGTSRFDEEIRHARPAAEGWIHPLDAEAQGISDGDTVSVEWANASLMLRLRIESGVVPGTLQVPAGLPELSVFELIQGAQYPRVAINRRVMEEVV